MKNLCNKTRPKERPYEVWKMGGWTWSILKKWQGDDDKEYARAFCFVTSPFCPDGEYGDVYIQDYKNGTLVKTNYDSDTTDRISHF